MFMQNRLSFGVKVMMPISFLRKQSISRMDLRNIVKKGQIDYNAMELCYVYALSNHIIY